MIRWHAAIVDHQQLRHEQTPLSSPSTSSGPSRDLVRPRVVMPSTLGANGPILFCLHIKAPQSRLPLPYRGFPHRVNCARRSRLTRLGQVVCRYVTALMSPALILLRPIMLFCYQAGVFSSLDLDGYYKRL